MQRQKSILSYLQKPSSENLKSDGMPNARRLAEQSTAPEIRGTDTPPEKLPRQIFAANFPANDDARPSLFSSIMHKFAKVDDQDSSRERNHADGGSSSVCLISSKNSNGQGLHKQGTPSRAPQKDNVFNSNDADDPACPSNIEGVSDILGPETPAMQPLVPRLKRIQEDCCSSDVNNYSSLLDSSKKVKLLHDSRTRNGNHDKVSETTGSKFEWLDPSLIRDANQRRPDNAVYDKRTLYIPSDVLRKMSASQKQYWSVKCQYMDVVLFFKVGKFYELYELDAEIGHKELDWKMTFSGVGKCRQVGISESGIDDAVQKLIARGYKVGRMEQLETSDQAKARGASSVIERKLIHVVTPSTTIDGNIEPDAVHLLALKEFSCVCIGVGQGVLHLDLMDGFVHVDEHGSCGLENGSTVFGFAFVDCAALKFWVGSIYDDASCAALGALLMQVSPKEVLYESRGLSKEAHKALKKYSSAGSTTLQLAPALSVTDFAEPSEVRKLIESREYFKESSNAWDYALDGVMHHDLAVYALGGLVGHLSRLMLDDALRNGDILPYQVYKGCLRMDGQTLVNLEIFSNNADGGTLYKYLDSCITASGKRLLRSWICHPLKNVGEINKRLNVVEELITHSEITFLVAQYLRKLPDIERLLGRVKASVGASASLLLPHIGKKILKQRVSAPPVVLPFKRVKISSKPIDILRLISYYFVKSIAGVMKVLKIDCPTKACSRFSVARACVEKIILFGFGWMFILHIIPLRVYLGAIQTVKEGKIFFYLSEEESVLSWPNRAPNTRVPLEVVRLSVKVFGTLVKGLRSGMDLLMILQKEENGILSLSIVVDLPMLSGSNGLDELLTQFEAAVDSDFPKYQDHDVTDSDAETLSVLIELFIEKAMQWSQVIHALSCIDVLRSFAVTANSSCGAMCRPIILPAHTKSMTLCQETRGPILQIKGLWHPYVIGDNGGIPVPNDIHLGENSTCYCPRTLLLTGPNMGGKSTLLRATCLAVILAQLGCYVPCEMCVLSPVDIIFTRLGATDRIMTGESTFFIECMETASVLQSATQDSLVLLDELGRGTSTFDGYAIAYAVFRHLVEKVQCRLLFATHYHPLTKEFASHPHVTLQHMACTFKPKTNSSFKGDQELVFLYRLTSGACPESYGLQVALMAGIPKQVVEAASKASQVMKESIGENFRSSEQRSEFSTVHEEWFKTLLAVSRVGEGNMDDDVSDTLFCLWHELKSSYRLSSRKE
ncbi:hypothetical protein HHK36_021581 [Tetracentron sinense]|uniref:DNA mismatch repair protein n=1 Tax=Tetracentron sinense TaxID=13715 RepID=A0A834YQ04_TETSI|nr:hypothetical protein HHK36_021581 [Tetracentron sinense]